MTAKPSRTAAATDQVRAKDILDSIRRIVRGLRVASRAAEKDLGLSSAQLFVLQKLRQTEGMSLNELAEQTLTHQSSVSVVVGRLVEQGLVKRINAARDARRLELFLTSTGRAFVRKLPETIQERLISAIGRMPAGIRDELARGLGRLVVDAGLADEIPALFFEDGLTKRRKRAKKAGGRHEGPG
jgi:DNA-binding MarR family transcriptional regulator